ncbi:MAG: inorganic phosphate transporter [Eggerthellales bacterium]|nr:inorganic phosphate transporter [Eggerthellales bacterium]
MGIDLSITALFSQMAAYPMLAVIVVLVILVTIIAGATDAPNAIATAVSTRSMSPGAALALAAAFNFLGLIGITTISAAVAKTMFSMVEFRGSPHDTLMCLMAAMIASIGWGVFCWLKGIPASKSHSLIAGITGGAIALGGAGAVVVGEWVKVLEGMAFSLFAGFAAGWLIVRFVEKVFATCDRRKSNKACTVIMNVCAIILSGLHGAQDGQKFMSVALLGFLLSFDYGYNDLAGVGFPLWLMVLCSSAISLGTLIGGKRIIKSVAMDMVKLDKYQGVAASAATSIVLGISTFMGWPVSTSHCSTSAIMGVGASKNPREVKWNIAGNMVRAWILTFPCCGFIGWALASLFILL